MYSCTKMKSVDTMERITRQQLADNLDKILARIDKEDIGFVILDSEGKDSEVICPAEWMECFLVETPKETSKPIRRYDMGQPVWNVYYQNRTTRKITTFNALSHGGVLKDIVKATKKCKTKEEFAEALEHTLMYYYWSKCEWEIILSPWPPRDSEQDIKIDVYDQIKLNWDHFVDYVWNERKNIKYEDKLD